MVAVQWNTALATSTNATVTMKLLERPTSPWSKNALSLSHTHTLTHTKSHTYTRQPTHILKPQTNELLAGDKTRTAESFWCIWTTPTSTTHASTDTYMLPFPTVLCTDLSVYSCLTSNTYQPECKHFRHTWQTHHWDDFQLRWPSCVIVILHKTERKLWHKSYCYSSGSKNRSWNR